MFLAWVEILKEIKGQGDDRSDGQQDPEGN
jgi:hypothetical protein